VETSTLTETRARWYIHVSGNILRIGLDGTGWDAMIGKGAPLPTWHKKDLLFPECPTSCCSMIGMLRDVGRPSDRISPGRWAMTMRMRTGTGGPYIDHLVVVTEDRLVVLWQNVEERRRGRSSPNDDHLNPTSIRSEAVPAPRVHIAAGL